MERKNRRYIRFIVSDSRKAAEILEKDFGTGNYEICEENSIRLLDVDLPAAAVNRTFVRQGVDVSEVHLCEDTLEDYFKKVTGGEGIA